MFDLFTLHRVAAAAEHCAANILESAHKMPDVDPATMSAISGAFMGFAVVLRADLGEVDLTTMSDDVKQRIMDKVTTDNTTDRT